MIDLNKDTSTIINAENLILGRMSSIIAKRLLNGEEVIVINAEKAIISGKKASIIKRSKEFLQVGHPRKGPIHPKKPEKIVKRTIRGMLPWKKSKGRTAYKRLKVFAGEPEVIKNGYSSLIHNLDQLKGPYITIEELSKAFGKGKMDE